MIQSNKADRETPPQGYVVSESSPHNEEGKWIPVRVFVGDEAKEKANKWIDSATHDRANDKVSGEGWEFRIHEVKVEG